MSSTMRQCLMLRMIPWHPKKIDTATIEYRLKENDIHIHRRTIQRDLEHLSTIFPLVCDDREKPYGWSWSAEAELFDIPQMDPLTAFSFRMMEEFLLSAMPPASLKALKPHFRHASKVLESIHADQLKSWPDKVKILSRSQPLTPPAIKSSVLDTVYECLMEGRKFSASYRRRGQSNAVSYTINPLGIVLLDRIIYLVCTMRDYNQMKDIRQLALHRFVSTEKMEEAGLVPDDFELQTYIDSGAFSYLKGEEPIELEILLDNPVAAHLYESPLSSDQIITEYDEHRVCIKATVLDTAQLRWWLLGFGEFVEVRKPDNLREEFRQKSARMHAMYRLI
ncbi:helix-turn-helix transcriptional regulator [Desulfobotulus mexicanus]|uniref:WYL domain-containing protein n=1 Tax=Desulfobotulus mexicanus TaxID=2586642 RepID=A0A5S5MFM8_9BACT|nr:WYL domain-containing protein [Desulfobotulus mexicanus]TYT74477.1 WYL domain-containing protein [Desulfobotulus mexicanus]